MADSRRLPASNADAPSVTRVISFSDAVFAIAITLLALLPSLPSWCSAC